MKNNIEPFSLVLFLIFQVIGTETSSNVLKIFSAFHVFFLVSQENRLALRATNRYCISIVELLHGTSLPSRIAVSSAATSDSSLEKFTKEGGFRVEVNISARDRFHI